MTILWKYIFRNHIPPFLFGSFTVIFLFLFQFIMKYIDQLVGKGLDTWVIIELIVLNLPWMVVLAVPMGVLFSTLMAFGNMSALSEITIIKASGGSLIKMMYPMIFAGAVLTLAVFWFNDSVLPDANHRARNLLWDIQRKKPTIAIEAGQFSTQLEDYTILARSIDTSYGTLKNVTIYENRLKNEVSSISADSATIVFNKDYTKLILTMFSGELYQYKPFSAENVKVMKFDKYQVIIKTSDYEFKETGKDVVARGDREMNIANMKKIIAEARTNKNIVAQRVNNEIDKHFKSLLLLDNNELTLPKNTPQNKIEDNSKNIFQADTESKVNSISSDTVKMKYLPANDNEIKNKLHIFRTQLSSDLYQIEQFELKARQYEVEVYKKYAIPFACLIFVFIGCPLGIITRGGNFGISAGISLLFYIFYWACLIGGEKLADRGYLSTFLSMWSGNILVGIAGIILTFRINNESFRFSDIAKKLFRKKRSATENIPS